MIRMNRCRRRLFRLVRIVVHVIIGSIIVFIVRLRSIRVLVCI